MKSLKKVLYMLGSKDQIKKMKILRESIKRRSEIYSGVGKMYGPDTTSSLRALRKAPAPGKKLQKAGMIMFWIPEPTGITCAAGGPMILTGRYLDKVYNSATISDIGEETKNMAVNLKDFKDNLA